MVLSKLRKPAILETVMDVQLELSLDLSLTISIIEMDERICFKNDLIFHGSDSGAVKEVQD